MLADGGFGNPQTLGNLSIKHALRTQRNNLLLTNSERRRSLSLPTNTQISQRRRLKPLHHLAIAHTHNNLRQLVGILLTNQTLRTSLHQLVPITLDGKTRRTKNRHMLAHQTQPTTSSRPLQTFHRHIKNQQTDIAVRVLTAFYRLIARSRSPHHICGRHFAGNDGTERIQRSRIIVDQRDAMNLRMLFRRGHYAITFFSHTAIAAMLGSWDSRQWRYRRCRQRELLHTHMLVCW